MAAPAVIPRVLWAYWRGGEPSWLRLQTVETFRRHHPAWDVRFLRDRPGETLPGWWPTGLPEEMPPDARCDVVRWCALAAEGGFFSDLDVLYLRPVPDDWLDAATLLVTCDGGTPEGRGLGRHRRFAIGLVGAPAGDPLVREVALRAMRRAVTWTPPTDHQACGSRLLAEELRTAEADTGRRAENLPAASFYPQGFLRAQNAEIWDNDARAARCLENLDGLHWGGGHEESRRMDRLADEAWARRSKCMVACAWRRAILGAD